MNPHVSAAQFDWSFFGSSLFTPGEVFLQGVFITIYVAVISQLLGVLLGLPIALGLRSRSRLLHALAWSYSWLWRGTPLLVQLLIVYTGISAAGIYKWPPLTLGTVTVPGSIQAAILTLSLAEAAYMAEIFRAAIGSIDKGQTEAAKSLGMTPSMTMRRVILPQAARIVMPPLGNDFTVMLKSTSLLSVIGVTDLFGTVQNINSTTFKTFEIFLVAALWYLLLTSVWSLLQARIEKALARSDRAPAAAVSGSGFFKRTLGTQIGARP